MKRTKWITGIAGAACAVMISAAAMPVFAAEPEADVSAEAGNYSYLAGRQRSVSRNELYAQAALIEDEDERKEFLIENGIADTEYSEEAAASYSYVSGRERGAGYRSSDGTEQTETQSSYSYAAGRQRGSSYRQ